ncbi:MAG: fused MFS/spermidine synthase, partial [Cyanobacteria bacterium HKST-UBA03]|nr:fused MFS/spermidine synthase [Cyanobacteria bacterium HKST-UBA03]
MPLIEKNETSAVSADNKPSTGRFDYFSLDRLLSDRDTSLSWAMVGAFIDQTVVSPLAKTLGETRAVITASPLSAATAGIFFLSGLAALVYQVVWQRVLTQAIGVDSVSIAFIVTIFMIGLGFGSLAGGAVTAKARKHLVLVYAIIELLIGAYGLISIPVLRQVNAVVAGWGVHSVFIDFGVNALALMLPIFLMGMTTPIIVDFIKSSLNRLGHTIGVFYGINVLGAASGALLTLFFIELFGLQGCTLLAASINIMLGIGFFVLAGAFKQHQTVKHAEPDNQQETQLAANQKGAVRLSTPLSWQVIASAFLFGFVTLSLQMVFFRILYSFFSPISYVFPVMLSSYLLLMASGQIVAGHAVDTMAAHLRPRMLVYLLLGGAVSSLAVLSIPVAWLDNLYWTITWPVMIFYLVPAMLLSAVMMLPIAFFSGYLPVVSRLITDDIRFAGV